MKTKHSTSVVLKNRSESSPNSSSYASTSPPESFELPEAAFVFGFPVIKYCVDQGAQFAFFRQYVYAATGPSKTDLNWIVPVYDNSKPDGALSDITAALGLLAISRGNEDFSLQAVASRKYSLALKKLQYALASATLAKSDETLTTVILLALHEVSTRRIYWSRSSR